MKCRWSRIVGFCNNHSRWTIRNLKWSTSSFSTVLCGCLIDTPLLIVQASTSSRLSTRGTAPWIPSSLWKRTFPWFRPWLTAARGSGRHSRRWNGYRCFHDWLFVCVLVCPMWSEKMRTMSLPLTAYSCVNSHNSTKNEDVVNMKLDWDHVFDVELTIFLNCLFNYLLKKIRLYLKS